MVVLTTDYEEGVMSKYKHRNTVILSINRTEHELILNWDGEVWMSMFITIYILM